MRSSMSQDITEAETKFLQKYATISSFCLIFNAAFILGITGLHAALELFTFKSAKKMENTSQVSLFLNKTPQNEKRLP